MLGDLKNLASMMGQAKGLREKFEQLQGELVRMTVEAEAGAGAVRVVANGKLEITSIRFDGPLLASLVGVGNDADQQMIEDLTTAAANAALTKAKQMVQQEASRLTGGLNIPGLDKMLGGGIGTDE